MLHYNHNYKSFHLYEDLNEVSHDPGRLIVVAGVVLMTLVCFHVLQSYVFVLSTRSGVVLGDALSQTNSTDTHELYTASVKSLVGDYLSFRVYYLDLFEKEILTMSDYDAWRRFAEKTQRKILSMGIPSRFQEIHILLIITLANEVTLLSDYDSLNKANIQTLTTEWDELLSSYAWINK